MAQARMPHDNTRQPSLPGRLNRPAAVVAFAAAIATAAFVSAPASGADTQTVTFTAGATQTFSYTGAEQMYVVPAGVTAVRVDAVGGRGDGDSGAGGNPHKVVGAISVTPGETLYVEVGGNGNDAVGGFNGGGA